MESWVFLLVGGVGATGAALALGTIAALVQYRRTGTLPGSDGDDVPPPGPTTTRLLVARIILGVVIAVVCVAVLIEQGLVAGPLLG